MPVTTSIEITAPPAVVRKKESKASIFSSVIPIYPGIYTQRVHPLHLGLIFEDFEVESASGPLN